MTIPPQLLFCVSRETLHPGASMNRVVKDGHFELEVSRSKFIAFVTSVTSSRHVDEHRAAARKAHPSASHVVFACAVDEGSQPLRRSSDAGEPRGTAGKPVLAVIDGADLINALAIVIRYFGGTKLGTGGLVRAYGAAARGALENAIIAPAIPTVTLEVTSPFALEDLLRRECQSAGARLLGARYSAEVTLEVELRSDTVLDFEHRIGNAAAGKARVEKKTAAEP